MGPMITCHLLDDASCEQINGGQLLSARNDINVAVPTNVAAPTLVGVVVLSRDVVLTQTARIRQRNRT